MSMGAWCILKKQMPNYLCYTWWGWGCYGTSGSEVFPCGLIICLHNKTQEFWTSTAVLVCWVCLHGCQRLYVVYACNPFDC